MIVPANRLLFWTGAVVIPFSALAALVPEKSGLCMMPVGLLLLVVSIDAFLSARGLRVIKVEFPEVVRISRGREGMISFVAENQSAKNRRIRIGLAFPSGILTAGDDMVLNLPGSSRTLFKWACTPLSRGSYLLDRCYLEGASPLGFWAVRKSVAISAEIRAYPDLLNERKQMAALFLSRGNHGTRVRRQVGQGRDFEKLRDYVHGDSCEHIHWKVTAKRGRPVTKVFQIEKTQEVYVIIDASRLSGRSPVTAGISEHQGDISHPISILERFVTSALIMGTAAERQGDLFGMLTFSDRIKHFTRARSGRDHYINCREALCTIQPEMVNPDFGELFSFIGTKLRRRALLIFLTSLDDPALAESFISGIGMIARKHLVVVNMLRPSGVKPLFSGPEEASVGDLYGALGGHLIWHNLREAAKVLEHRGVRFNLLDNEKICSEMVSQYMDMKQRQLL
jgi:uncharacterized protein (DUF58 family)